MDEIRRLGRHLDWTGRTQKEMDVRIALGGDSAGEPLVKVLTAYLKEKGGHEATDLSRPDDGSSEFYAGLSDRVAKRVLEGEFDRAILCCGTGIGVSISDNKITHIRAALTHDTYSAERAALSNDAQIITMGARVIGPELAKSIVDAFLKNTFDPARHSARNVAAINALDGTYARG